MTVTVLSNTCIVGRPLFQLSVLLDQVLGWAHHCVTIGMVAFTALLSAVIIVLMLSLQAFPGQAWWRA